MSAIIDEIVYALVKTNISDKEKREIFQLIRLLRAQVDLRIKETPGGNNVSSSGSGTLDS